MLTKDHASTSILYEVDMSKNNNSHHPGMHVLWWWEVDGKKLANQVKMCISRSSQFLAQALWSWTVFYPPPRKKNEGRHGKCFFGTILQDSLYKIDTCTILLPPWIVGVLWDGEISFDMSLSIPYSWWKKSCTTWHVWNPVNNGINYLSSGAGLFPSTVSSNEGWSFLGGQLLQSRLHFRT